MRGSVCIPFQLVSDPEETVSKSSLSIRSARLYVSSDVHKIKKVIELCVRSCLYVFVVFHVVAAAADVGTGMLEPPVVASPTDS